MPDYAPIFALDNNNLNLMTAILIAVMFVAWIGQALKDGANLK